MTPSELRASGLIPDGYEILPVEVIRDLIDAGYAAYGPAFGGDTARPNNAARAAENVLTRRKRGNL